MFYIVVAPTSFVDFFIVMTISKKLKIALKLFRELTIEPMHYYAKNIINF